MEISGTQAEWIRLCFGSPLSRLLRPKVRSDVGSGRRGWAAETPSRIAFLRHPRVPGKGTRSVSRGRAAGRPTERAKKADFEGGLWWGGPSGKQLLLTVCPPEQIAAVVAPPEPEGAAGAAARWGWGSAAMQKRRQHTAALPGWLSSARDPTPDSDCRRVVCLCLPNPESQRNPDREAAFLSRVQIP